jgi:hypothetical protein
MSGVLFGITLAVLGIIFHYKQLVTNGVFVECKYLKRDQYILYYVKQLRPYYQTSKLSVSAGFHRFIKKIDQALYNSQMFVDDFFVEDSMALLSDDRKKPTQSGDVFVRLKADMRQLLIDHVSRAGN